MGAVGHYIHLNPVRAKFLTLEKLAQYRFASYYYLRTPKSRPGCLTFAAMLSAAGGLADTRAGWDSYAAYLEWLTENEPAQKGLAFDRMCQGWALGSREFKQGLLREHQQRMERTVLDGETSAELRPLQWQAALKAGLRRLGKTLDHAQEDPKGAPWKVALATHLKTTTTASNPWLAETLHMGAPAALSRYVTECKTGRRRDARRWQAKISIS